MVKNLSAMCKTWVQSLSWEDPLEKKMATHSSILARRIPWTQEPGELQSLGMKRVGHDWGTNTFTSAIHKDSSRVFVTLWTVAARLLCPWDSPGKNTGMNYCFLLQGIFPAQGLNPHLLCLLHCRQVLYLLSHQGILCNELYKNSKAWDSESFWVREHTEIWEEGTEIMCAFLVPCPIHLFHLTNLELYL